MSKLVEYRVRPVTRYIVTRYEGDDRGGCSAPIGEYASEETAYAVGYAMCKKEHNDSGEPLDSMSFIYPEPPLKGVVLLTSGCSDGDAFTSAEIPA
jgi:hypothetical protein